MVTFKSLINYKGRWIALLAVLLLFGCKEDSEEQFPRLRAEFFDVYVDKDTFATNITLDNGRVYPLNIGNTIKSQVSDTIIRCYGNVEISSDSSFASIYGLYQAHCFAPAAPNKYKPHIFYKNKVNVVTVYKARNYINAILGVKISGSYDHVYDFIKDSITTDPQTKKKTMHLTFFHYKSDEEFEAYTHKVYLSIPLEEQYYEKNEKFDSLEFHVFTYDGEKKYKYAR